MTAVDVDALEAAYEEYGVRGVGAALPDLLAEVRRGRALREAVEGLAEQWLASSVLGLSALAGAGRELRRALATVDGGEQ